MSRIRSRTEEFHRTVDAIRNRHLPPGTARPSSLARAQSNHVGKRSEFNRRATDISHEMTDVAKKLDKLSERKSSVFDDRPMEMNAQTHTIRTDIARLNKSIASLQQFSRAGPVATGLGTSRGAQEHANNVVVQLQSRLAETSMKFKNVLEERSTAMKSSRDRREQFMSTPSQNGLIPMGTSPLYNSERSRTPDPHNRGHTTGDDSFAIDMGPDDGARQQLLFEQRNNYMESRASAMESIEATIQELGGIFTQLARMVSEQRDMVTRIDSNVDEMHTNISAAQRELLKYYRTISSNRALMLKMFVVILIFFFLYVVVL